MSVNLHWDESLPAAQPGADGTTRWATYDTVSEALEQAAADDGMTATKIVDADSGDQVKSRQDIRSYVKQRRDLEADRDAAVAKAQDAHKAALAGTVE